MAATLANLRQRKFSLLSLTVTQANLRAVELYKRLGFETKRVFDAFVRERVRGKGRTHPRTAKSFSLLAILLHERRSFGVQV